MRFKNMLIGKYVRIYKMQTFCRETFGYSVRTRNLATGQKVATERGAYVFHVRIRNFYSRDDVSRSTAGKRETVTKGKRKKQKRYLIDTLINLHHKHLVENPSIKVSYSLFCKLQPFWVLIPSSK